MHVFDKIETTVYISSTYFSYGFSFFVFFFMFLIFVLCFFESIFVGQGTDPDGTRTIMRLDGRKPDFPGGIEAEGATLNPSSYNLFFHGFC